MSLRKPQTASSSSPPNTTFYPRCNFDIFLSFRGEDTRRNFTDHLYTALVKNGIHTFRDDEELRRGEMIDQNLARAIEESRFFIIIFSENYANSKCCLNELVKIMECIQRGAKAFPVFYHVDPSEVKKQSGNYGKVFADYENDANLEREQIHKWRTALTEASHLAGYHIENQYESEMIEKIISEILCEIIGEYCNEDGPVGKKPRLEVLKKLIDKPKDVLMVGIYGLSGTGKTTFAKALYDEISCQFEGASFLANIGEISKKDDLHCLQEQLFCDILLGEYREIRPFQRRNNLMKNKIRCKKVLIVLDDVNNTEQLKILAGEHAWFGKGSRIIITTRKIHLLHQHKVDEFYEPKGLDPHEALELFCRHANTKEESLYCFYPLSKQIIGYCDHHPLALQVVGSFLRGKSYLHWQVQLENLARESARENLNILRVSYNGLSRQEQYIFLDVACFFKGEHKDFVTKMLDGHDFSAEDGVKVLIERCLVTISERKLWMHSIIQKLGWQIVREADKPCRLWDHMDIQRLLRKRKGMHAVEGISLDLSKSNQIHFSTEVFAEMTELKLLRVFLDSDCVNGSKENYKVNFSRDFRLPCFVLRYLHWHGYQLEFYPSNFEAMELLELNMPYSCLKQINGNEIYFPKLTTLNLSHSQHLENISNFSRMPNLERLVLEGCGSLVEVDPSIGDLHKLSLVNLKDCKRLNSLPNSICELKRLETLILTGCLGLEKLPDDFGKPQRSVNLEANETSIRVITLPLKLRILHLRHCKGLQGVQNLPSSIQEVDGYNSISMGTSLWNTKVAPFIIQRIKINPESMFSIVLPGDKIPECCDKLTGSSATGSSVTMELQNPDWYNDDFLGFAVCLVFAPQAERLQLHPEILCELNNFSFFYYCGADSVDEFEESDKRWGENSTDYVWLAYRPRARADRCRRKEWNHIKASFEVFDCVVKKCAIRLIYK